MFTLLALVMLTFLSIFCRSVARCEALVKKQYSLLGWEYRNTDSDDGQNITDCGKMQSIEVKLHLYLIYWLPSM